MVAHEPAPLPPAVPQPAPAIERSPVLSTWTHLIPNQKVQFTVTDEELTSSVVMSRVVTFWRVVEFPITKKLLVVVAPPKIVRPPPVVPAPIVEEASE